MKPKNINKRFSEIKNVINQNSFLIGRIEQENVMFKWTKNYKYLDVLKIEFLEKNLEKKNDMIANVVTGFFSLTKKFKSFEEAKNLGYSLYGRYVNFENDNIYLEVAKFECIDEENYKKAFEYAWKNSISRDFSEFFKRID